MMSWVGCPTCGCPVSCPGARTLGPAWRLVATALLLATPSPCVGRSGARRAKSFGSHKTANPRTLSCATRGGTLRCPGRCPTRMAAMKGAAACARRRIGDARCVSPPVAAPVATQIGTERKTGLPLTTRTHAPSGRAERRPDARDVRRTGLISGPRNNVLDLDMCGSSGRIDDLVRNIIGHHRYQIIVD